MTWSAAIPPNTEILRGAWWTTYQPDAPQVSVIEEAYKLLNLHIGSRLEWQISGKTVTATVAAVHKTENIRPGSNIEFILTPGPLDNLPALYFGGIKVKPTDIPTLQREAFKQFPAITVINIADVLDRVQEVVDQIAVVVRFISGFSILAGITIQADEHSRTARSGGRKKSKTLPNRITKY